MQSQEIRKHGILVRLAPQPFRVLVMLIEGRGELVDREELHTRLWGEDQLNVEFDVGLNRCIRQIRAALSDSAESPRYIQTEPRRGYRFVASVDMEGAAPASVPLPPAPVLDAQLRSLTAVPVSASQPGVEHLSLKAGSADSDYLAGANSPRTRRLGVLRYSWTAAILVLLSSALLLWRSRPRDQPSGLNTVPLATGLGKQLAPTFSPDGKRVAFTWAPDNGDNFDVYVKTIDTPSLVRLTTDPQIDYSPAWSPDGQTIAFCRGSASLGGAVYTIPAVGGAERKILDLAVIAAPSVRGLSWMPDSKRLVITEPLSAGNSAVTIADTATGETQQLWPARPGEEFAFPSVSPDGKTIAYTDDTGRGLSRIYLLRTVPDSVPYLLPGLNKDPKFQSSYSAQPAWTPEGKHIVFASNVDGQGHLWLSHIHAGTRPEVLGGLGNHLESPALSPLGQLAAAHSIHDRNIWRLELPGNTSSTSHIPAVSIASTQDDGEPTLAPDASQIAFASDRGGFAEIWDEFDRCIESHSPHSPRQTQHGLSGLVS